MAPSARITDIKALSQFRPALVRFGEESQVALTSPGSNASRVLGWLQRERLPHWKRQIRVRSEEAVRANTKLIELGQAENPRPTVEARQAYEKAKRQIREAEAKLELTKRWIRTMEKEIGRYRSAIQPMASITRSGMTEAAARIDGLISSLDAYVLLKAPEVGGGVDVPSPEVEPSDGAEPGAGNGPAGEEGQADGAGS